MGVTLHGPHGRGDGGARPVARAHDADEVVSAASLTAAAPTGATPAATPAAAPRAAQTASQRIIAAANELQYVTDATGRVLGWRKLDALDDFDLAEIAGARNVGNPQWMVFATIAFAVRTIDGKPLARPTTKDQLRARIKLLGAHGIDAVYNQIVPPEPVAADPAAVDGDLLGAELPIGPGVEAGEGDERLAGLPPGVARAKN